MRSCIQWGGEEFAILAIGQPDVTPEVLTARLLHNIDTFNRLDARTYRLSLSVDIAFYDPELPASLDELLAKADTLMYEQKRSKQG